MPIDLPKNAAIFKFAEVGDTIEGVITELDVQPLPEGFTEDGKPFGQKMSRKGKPLTQWSITLDTDDGMFRFFSTWRMERAITDAARRAGVSQVTEGDMLVVKFAGTEKAANAPVPAKVFEAAYVVSDKKDDLESAKAAFGADANEEPPF